MFEIEFSKEMTRDDGSKVDVTITAHYATERRMYKDVKNIVIECRKEGAWMQFKYIGPKRD